MVFTSTTDKNESDYDWNNKLKVFDESQAGVKGFLDASVEKIPPIFVHHPNKIQSNSVFGDSKFGIPLIDFEGIDRNASMRGEVVERIRDSCGNWGFFQMISHGIPLASWMEWLMECLLFVGIYILAKGTIRLGPTTQIMKIYLFVFDIGNSITKVVKVIHFKVLW